VLLELLMLFALLAAGGVYAQTIPARSSKAKPGLIRISNEIPYSSDLDHPGGKAALAFDDQYAYLASPGGLYRTPLPITQQSKFVLIGFAGRNIYNLYVNNGLLYVLKESIAAEGESATDHSFLRSDNHGETFVPLDGGLEECNSGFCEFLAPTEALFRNGLIFINAGAGDNLFVTPDNGASWTALLGSFHRKIGNYQSFGLTGNRMIVGGESLDQGYLRSGILRPDMLGWKESPADVSAPSLANRGPLLIKSRPDSSDVYAAVPCGLLKSTDGGQTFHFVMEYPITGSPTPYISDMIFPSHAANVIVAAGRGPDKPYLVYSKDNGETWLDISANLRSMVASPGSGTQTSSIDFLTEDGQGNIFAGVVYGPTHSLKLLRLNFNSAMFR
jgi:hypothetical protein